MMQNAIGFASIFGPFLIIMGLWMLFYYDNMMKMITSAKNTPAVFCVTGVISLLVGLTVITNFNMWSWSLAVLVTIYGWWMVLKGFMTFFLPQMLIKCTMSNTKWLKVKGIIPLVWGLGMCWLAYWSK